MDVSATEWKHISSEVLGRLEQWYRPRTDRLGVKGSRLVDEALTKGGLRGGVKVRLLFDPAVLLAEQESIDALDDLGAISRLVPFTGNYGIWEPIRANFAMISRRAAIAADTRAGHYEQLVCWPENGEKPGPIQLTAAAINRANGLVVEQLRSDFTPPLKRAELSHTIERIRELNVMWALGGSAAWARSRINKAVESAYTLAAGG